MARPIPPSPPVTSALTPVAPSRSSQAEPGYASGWRRTRGTSRLEDDLADVRARLDQRVRRVGVGEWEARADDRVDLLLRPQREQLERALAHERRLQLHQPAEEDADHRHVAADEPLHARIGPQPAGEADGDDRPERVQERERTGEDLAADRVDDHVDAQVVDLVVAHRLVGAELARE